MGSNGTIALACSSVAAIWIAGTSIARAQEPPPNPGSAAAPDAPAPAPAPPPPPTEAIPPPPPAPYAPVSSAPAAYAPPREQDDGSRGSIVAETFGGVVGYALGAAAGIGILYLAVAGESIAGLLAGIPLAVFVAGTGLAGGVTVGGDASGGQGRFWAAFGGQAVGGLLSLMVFLATAGDDETSVPLTLGSMIVFPIVGGVTGYALSDHPRDR